MGLSTPGNFSFILHRLLTNVQLQILQNSLLEIGIPCTEIRGDPLTDPLQDGGGRIGRLEFWKRAQSPPISDTLTRSGLSADSSGPRGRGFKSRHSDQSRQNLRLTIVIRRFCCFLFKLHQNRRSKLAIIACYKCRQADLRRLVISQTCFYLCFRK